MTKISLCSSPMSFHYEYILVISIFMDDIQLCTPNVSHINDECTFEKNIEITSVIWLNHIPY